MELTKEDKALLVSKLKAHIQKIESGATILEFTEEAKSIDVTAPDDRCVNYIPSGETRIVLAYKE